MSQQECHEFLTRLSFGRLASARDNQPYVVPIYFAFEPNRLYGFATMGQKIEWMRSNPLVCVEVDEVQSHIHWSSIVLQGRYEDSRTHLNTQSGGSRRKPYSRRDLCGGKLDLQLPRLARSLTETSPSSIAFTSRRSAGAAFQLIPLKDHSGCPPLHLTVFEEASDDVRHAIDPMPRPSLFTEMCEEDFDICEPHLLERFACRVFQELG
jgi:hypothetical protein